MKKIFLIAILAILTCSNLKSEKKYKIGVLIMATWKYIQFVPSLVDSAKKYFIPEHDIHFFVFTDQFLEESSNIKKLYTERKGWPYDTLMRYHEYVKYKDSFSGMDYLFAIDADVLFTSYIGEEVLGNLTAVPHDIFLGRRGTYETSLNSLACVKPNEGSYYFSGAFIGGKTKSFLEMSESIKSTIDADLKNNIIALHNDESYINRYFIDNPPAIVLSTCYGWPDNRKPRVKPKMLFLSKKHNEFQVRLEKVENAKY